MKKILGLLSVFAVAALVNVAGAQSASAANYCYWKGGASWLFSHAANWVGDSCASGPKNDDVIVFGPAQTDLVRLTNDLSYTFSSIMYGYKYTPGSATPTPVTSTTVKTTYIIDKLVLGDGTAAPYKTSLDGRLLPDGTPSTVLQVSDLTFSSNAANTSPLLEITGYGLMSPKSATGACPELEFARINVTDVSSSALAPTQFLCPTVYKATDTLTIVKGQYTYATSAKHVNVTNGSTLKGQGAMTGALAVDAASKVAPGSSPGCLSSVGLRLDGEYLFEVAGSTACTGYDQLVSSGPVVIGTAAKLTTSVINNFIPGVGDTYRIIDNTTSQPIQGTFTGMPEGSTFTQAGTTYKISYVGGTGNDVTLTVVTVSKTETGSTTPTATPDATAGTTGEQGSAGAVGDTTQAPSNLPKVPNTGFELVRANPVMTALVTTGATAVLGILGRRLHS